MNKVQMKLTDKGEGLFYVDEGGELMGEMVVSITGSEMTVFHTEVSPKAQGMGIAKELLMVMVEYAREHQLKVIPLCPFVYAQFKRHPEEYADIWKTEHV